MSNPPFQEGEFFYKQIAENEVQIGTGIIDNIHNACVECPQKLVIPSQITHDGKTFTVTSIADGAFHQCNKSIKSVFIPKTVKQLGTSAFNTVRASEFKFEPGTKLTKISSYGITWIEPQHFTLPPNVEFLGDYSLRGLNKVKHLYYCGKTSFNLDNILSASEGIKIHVSSHYPGNTFASLPMYNHNLKCDFPYLTCNHNPSIFSKNKFVTQLFIFIITK